MCEQIHCNAVWSVPVGLVDVRRSRRNRASCLVPRKSPSQLECCPGITTGSSETKGPVSPPSSWEHCGYLLPLFSDYSLLDLYLIPFFLWQLYGSGPPQVWSPSWVNSLGCIPFVWIIGTSALFWFCHSLVQIESRRDSSSSQGLSDSFRVQSFLCSTLWPQNCVLGEASIKF